MKLILLRHGESKWNLENKFTGWTDVSLTKKGEEEAKQAAIAELDKSMKIVLTPDARSRLSRLNLVNPDLTTSVKTHLAKLAQTNQIAIPVNDAQLKNILSGLSKGKRETTIRRI